MAFNAKNLQYDKQEPTFLRRLKGQFSGLDGRHNVQIARPKKDRLKTGDDDEDDPVILDETGEKIEKAEFEKRMKGGEDETEAAVDGSGRERTETNEQVDAKQAERQKVAEIGSSSSNAKKRKAGKVIGGDEENERDQVDRSLEPATSTSHGGTIKTPSTKQNPVPKKKGKKIKLSFDDAEG